MPSKRELLKRQAQKNEISRGADSVLSEPISEESAQTAKEPMIINGYEVENKDEKAASDREISGSESTAEAIEVNKAGEDNINNISNIDNANNKSNKPSENNKDNVPNVTRSPGRPPKSAKIKETKTYSGKDKNYGMRLTSNEDVEFLDFYPIQLGQKKKQYFVTILEKEINEAFTKEINLSDPLIKMYQKGGTAQLASKNVTIAIPEDIIPDIKRAAAKYRMQSQKYVAFIVRKTRMNTKDYE